MNCVQSSGSHCIPLGCTFALALLLVTHSQAETESAPTIDNAKVKEAINRAADFLKKAQANDGSFSAKSGPGVTAIVAAALLRSGQSADDAVVSKALKYLEADRHDDGGVYQKGSNHKNYETCLAIIAFKEANGDHRYDD